MEVSEEKMHRKGEIKGGCSTRIEGWRQPEFAEARGYPAAVATSAPATVDQRTRRAMATVLSVAAETD